MNRLFVDELLSIGLVPKGDNPDAEVMIYKSKAETGVESSVRQGGTVGESVTSAIDARARAWHLEGRFVDVGLPHLRTRIRETMPALKVLERSRESVPVAKSRVAKAGDRELSAAFEFVSEWS